MFESKILSTNLKTQAIQEITRYIHTMDLGRDNKLPREEEFCKLLGISRVTLRAALDELEMRSIVIRRHGLGTFVNPHSLDVKVSFDPAIDLYESILRCGYQPTSKVLYNGQIPLSGAYAQEFELEPGAGVWRVQKVVYADNRFCALLEDIINISLLEDPSRLELCAQEMPIFPMLDQKFDLRVAWDKVEISAVQSRDVPALRTLVEQSGCKDGALLLIQGMNYDIAGRPVIWGSEYIDTDLIRFNQIRKRQWT